MFFSIMSSAILVITLRIESLQEWIPQAVYPELVTALEYKFRRNFDASRTAIFEEDAILSMKNRLDIRHKG